MFPSTSPNAKRSIKPTVQQPQPYAAGTSASPTQLTLSSNQPTGPYSTLGHPSDPFVTAAYSNQPPQAGPGPLSAPPPPQQPPNPRKRRAEETLQAQDVAPGPSSAPFGEADPLGPPGGDLGQPPSAPAPKKGRTNTPWTPAEEQRLKTMRDQGTSWSEIAKHFPSRTEGSVKKHWYKDMHYAEFAEDEVGLFVGLYWVDGHQDSEKLTEQAECCPTSGDQRVRIK
ncbi:MAG: hypothetical protein M1822_006681 [Bathelium mastoideum]|nr:MAG: hypothetical protein M1822_006681 [Bathelium mastoideum]